MDASPVAPRDTIPSRTPSRTPSLTALPKPTRNVWVLSGGGAQGAVQVGMMGTLIDNGHLPDAIIAVSVGSLNGVFMATDLSLKRVDELHRHWRNMNISRVFGTRREAAANLLRARSSVFSNVKLRSLVSEWTGADLLEELSVPVRIATTRLVTGNPSYHDEGPIVELISASAAVPALLPPVELTCPTIGIRDLHVDGGVSQNVPLSGVPGLMERLGWSDDDVEVFVLDATQAAKVRHLRTPVDTLAAALSATLAGQVEPALPNNVTLTRIKAGGTVTMVDFSKTDELVRVGRDRALSALAIRERRLAGHTELSESVLLGAQISA